MSGIPAGWDRLSAVGSLALRIEEHDVDGGGARTVVQGLRVTDLASGIRASYRPGSALYGFMGLPSGARRLLIEDESVRYVPRVLVATVTQPAPFVTTAVRPGPGYPVPRGQLVLWGDVIRSDGSAAPFALVKVGHASGATWTSTTDHTGRFLVWVRGLPLRDVDEGDWTFSLTVGGRASVPSEPTDSLPDDLDALDETALSTWFDLASPPLTLSVPQGVRTRIPTVTLF